MNAKQFFKKLNEAKKSQEIVESFMASVQKHFTDLGIYEVDVTYCKGDGFLFLDSRGKGDVYPITKKLVEDVLSLTSEEDVFSLFDSLNKQGVGL